MIRRRPAPKRVLIALLLLLSVVAGGILAMHRADQDLLVRRLGPSGATVPAQSSPAGGAEAASQPTASASQPESRFAVIALRPLFTAGRHPSEQQQTAIAAEESVAPDLLVTGIVIAGPDSVAILEPAKRGTSMGDSALVVHVGDGVAGWRVEAIEPGVVVFTRDGERHELPLAEEDDPRRPAARRTPVPGQPRTPVRQVQPAQQQPIQPQPNQPPQQPIQPAPSSR